MLSRVWVERAGSESAVFGGARPLSDLVDMPIDTVYMSMDMLCHATLCLCPLVPSLSLSPFASSSLRPHTWPPCSSILLISPRVTLGFFVPSFSPSHVISPASLRLSLVLNFFLLRDRPSRFHPRHTRAGDGAGVLVGERDGGGDGCGGGCAPMPAWWGCGGGGRWQTGETRRQGMTVVECRG